MAQHHLHDGTLRMRSALDNMASGPREMSPSVTPATARTARQAVLRHAASTHATMAALEQQPTFSVAPASAVLAELEEHLKESRAKQAKWKAVSNSTAGWRLTSYGPRSTPEWVHTHLLRDELASLENDVARGTIAKVRLERDRLLDDLAKDKRRAVAAEGELQQQLAEVTHASWVAKETLASSERSLRSKEEELSQVKVLHATEAGRCRALEKQVADMRAERDASTQSQVVGRESRYFPTFLPLPPTPARTPNPAAAPAPAPAPTPCPAPTTTPTSTTARWWPRSGAPSSTRNLARWSGSCALQRRMLRRPRRS